MRGDRTAGHCQETARLPNWTERYTRALLLSRLSVRAVLSVLQALLDLAAIPDSNSEPDA